MGIGIHKVKVLPPNCLEFLFWVESMLAVSGMRPIFQHGVLSTVSLQEYLGGLLRKLSSFDLTYLDFTLGTLIIFFPQGIFCG